MTPLALSGALIAKLRAFRAARRVPVDQVERDYDAVMLFGGMGPPGYLTMTGRILIGPDEFWGEPVVRDAKNDDEVIAMLVVGAKQTAIAELLDLTPAKPDDAVECPLCRGSRWWLLPGTVKGGPIICVLCSGRGWATQAMLDARPDLAPLRSMPRG